MNNFKKFNDFVEFNENFMSIEYLNGFGEINESHEYFDSISSLMGKTMRYSRNHFKVQTSSLNESAKRAFDKDIAFNSSERIGASMLFNEMYNKFVSETKIQMDVYDAIINGELDVLDEGLIDKIKAWGEKFADKGSEITSKTLKKAEDAAVEVASKAKDTIKSGVKKMSDAKDDLVAVAKKMKSELTEKIKNLYKIISGIVKKGISTAKDLVNYLLDAFSNIGDNLVEIAKGLGVYEIEKDEKPLDMEYPDGVNIEMKSKEDKNLFNHLFEFTNFIISDEKASKKLMEEGITDKIKGIFNNKYILWAKSMVSSVPMSTWKTIFFSLFSTVLIKALPWMLGVFLGVSCPIIPFVMALISLCINVKGIIKLIKDRNAQRKPGEKFFDTKTSIFFGIALLSTIMSITAVVSTFGPALAEICRAAGIVDDTEGFTGWLAGIAKKLEPKTALTDGHYEITGQEEVTKTSVSTQVDMDVATKFGKKDAAAVLKARAAIGGELGQGINDKVLKGIGTYGANGLIPGAVDAADYKKRLIAELIKGGQTAEHAKELANHVYLKEISDVTKELKDKIEWVKGAFVPLTSKMPWVATFIPFLDKKTWGTYKMRFASATRGYPAYVVEKSEIIDKDKVESLDGADGPAVKNLVKLHDESFNDAMDMLKKENDGEDVGDITEPGFIVVYINPNLDTKNDDDKANKKDDEKSKKNGAEISDEKKDRVPGIIIDPLTLMCADVAKMNGRRRLNPYFLTGVFSKLSFRPLKNNDNDTKEFIRTKLFGETLSSCIRNCVAYGVARKYIEIKEEGEKKEKKCVAVVREKNYMTDKDIDPKEKVDELGYMTPEEIVDCLNEFMSKNKTTKCYDLLDGKNATKLSVKMKDGKLVKSVKKDDFSIENVKYYKLKDKEIEELDKIYKEKLEAYKKLSKDDKKKLKEKYEKELEKYNALSPKEKKNTKKPVNKARRPSAPKYEYDVDGNKYKKATKKLIDEYGADNKEVFKDYVDIKIVPLISDKSTDVYKKLVDDKYIKKILFDEDGDLNMVVIEVLKPFLFRPEKTFSQNDEYELQKRLKDDAEVEGIKLSKYKAIRKIKNLFQDEEQEHDTFKKIVEIIWDELSGERRNEYSDIVDNHKSGKTNESVDYDDDLNYVFEDNDSGEYYDEECEVEYDEYILEMKDRKMLSELNSDTQPRFLKFSEFINR